MVSPASHTPRQRSTPSARFALRRPQATDGRSVHALIKACPPLDSNSLYLNLLQCTHFAETCVIADSAEASAPAGFISGYLVPDRPTTLFIWQVAIAEVARGHGLAKQMLLELLARPACKAVTHIETTITPTNGASWALFRSLARSLECPLADRVLFDRDAHLDGVHESEVLVTIGPFDSRGDAPAKQPRRTT